ncbi:hypothetical protein [Pyrococcus sp. ST04]|uniref:hypothetical protein n=1 Tax=Pyrococcus sp. ST04 TaxID=1183377 RepID=UPI0002605A5C|nr:hypothetical protein [Pyrococcus sp. ST04]AFK22029.1 hypothetical protein Py04_0427 [Pyrococcus sp. ST04]
MRVISTVPGRRQRLFKLLKLQLMFLIISSGLCFYFVIYFFYKDVMIKSLAYLVGGFFFLASYLMYKDFLDTIRKSRFNYYWNMFRQYSPPFGAYGSMYILVSLILLIGDFLRGGYFALAVFLGIKGLFEVALSKEIRSIMALSYLHFELTGGNLDRLVILDSSFHRV